MFEMNFDKLENWRTQFAISNPVVKMGLRFAPLCFAEQEASQNLILQNAMAKNSKQWYTKTS